MGENFKKQSVCIILLGLVTADVPGQDDVLVDSTRAVDIYRMVRCSLLTSGCGESNAKYRLA